MPIIDQPQTINLAAFNAGWTFSTQSGLVCDGPNKPFNNTPPPSPSNFAWITDLGTVEQAFTTTVGGVHTIALQTENRWFPHPTQTARVLVDGVVVGTIPANDGFRWSARSFAPSIPTPGPHTLRFEGIGVTGQSALTIFLDSVTITGPSGPVTLVNPSFDTYGLAPDGIVANPAAAATATLRADATVTTCGKLLKIFVAPIAGGDPINVGTVNQAPHVSVNGVDVGPLRTGSGPMYSTSAHPSFLVPLPSGVVVGPADSVTLTAPAGWLYGPSSYAEAMVAQAVANRVNRSFERPVDTPRTMWIGAGYAHEATAEWHPGFLPKNQAKRCAFWVPPNAREDAHANPLVLGGPSTSGPIVRVGAPSNVDALGCPTPTGYWAVRWDDLDGHSTAALATDGDPKTSCVEVTSLANPGVAGLGRVRVFNFQPTGFEVNLQVWLQLSSTNPRDPVTGGYPVAIQNLAVLAPGDFTWAANTPTVIPMPLWSDVAGAVDAQLPPSLPFGPHRLPTVGIQLGESAVCEREHAVEPDDFHWAQDAKVAIQIRYTQARPWTNATSPYIYDPLAGTDYPATLGANIATAPAAGTTETITISDAATAPVIAGLVLTIGSERMRVMSVSGTSVTVLRGSESTTPATHAAGVISVSARRSMPDLASFGVNNKQITELVTQAPHGLKTGQIIPFDGDGWPAFEYTDGRGFNTLTPNDLGYHGFKPYHMPIYVTGATTLLTIWNGYAVVNPQNTTLKAAWTLNPGPATYDCTTLFYLPEYGAVPYELSATLSARHPGTPARVTFGMVASDDMVDSIWHNRILPYLPADRDVYVEVGDEPWNFSGAPSNYWYNMSWQLYGQNSPYYYYGMFVARVRARGRAIWAAAGRDPMHVRSTFNLQCAPGNEGLVAPLLDFFAARSATPDVIEIAPYYESYTDPAVYAAYAAWDTDMLVDAWIWDFYENASTGDRLWAGGQVHRTGDYGVAIRAWNTARSPAVPVRLGIYEYGPAIAWPVYLTSSSDSGGLGAAMDATTTTLMLPNANVYNVHYDNWDDCQKVCPGTWLHVGEEWMTVVSRSGATCTVVRGQGGTTAAPHPAGSYLQNDWGEGTRDLTLHPNFRICHFDAMCLFQALGVDMCMPASLNQEWSGGNAWADYHAIGQQPGMGDGSDGKFDNRLCLARRGLPHSKTATVSQDAVTVSPRGRAMIEFVTPATTTGGGGHRPYVIRRRKGRAVAR